MPTPKRAPAPQAPLSDPRLPVARAEGPRRRAPAPQETDVAGVLRVVRQDAPRHRRGKAAQAPPS